MICGVLGGTTSGCGVGYLGASPPLSNTHAATPVKRPTMLMGSGSRSAFGQNVFFAPLEYILYILYLNRMMIPFNNIAKYKNLDILGWCKGLVVL